MATFIACAAACKADGPVDAAPADAAFVDVAAPAEADPSTEPDGSLADDATRREAGEGGPTDATQPASDARSARLVAYASGYGPNIVTFSVNAASGALSPASSVAAFGSSPSFLVHNATMTNLYAVDENATGRVGAYAIDPSSGALTFLDAVSSGGNGPAFVGLDAAGKFVFVANYGDGTVSVLPVGAGGRLGAASDTTKVGAQAHMIVADPSNAFVFVPCKGSDYVAQFTFDSGTGKLAPNTNGPQVATAKGAGPRHLAFHPNGRLAFLINETNSTVTSFAFDVTKGTLSAIETQTTLPAGFAGTSTAAEVWVHPSGRWVLGSNRGDDSLVVFAVDPTTGKMTLKGFTKAGGTTPRDFALDPTGTWLYAADQGSGMVVPFRFDSSQGSLTPLGGAANVIAASYVGFGSLP